MYDYFVIWLMIDDIFSTVGLYISFTYFVRQ